MTRAQRRLLLGFGTGIALLYLFTWLIGVPAVVSDVATNRLRDGEWWILREGGSPSASDEYPWFRLNLVLPVAPGIVFVSHGGEVAPLAGYGEWALYLCYGSGVRPLLKRVTWMS